MLSSKAQYVWVRVFKLKRCLPEASLQIPPIIFGSRIESDGRDAHGAQKPLGIAHELGSKKVSHIHFHQRGMTSDSRLLTSIISLCLQIFFVYISFLCVDK